MKLKFLVDGQKLSKKRDCFVVSDSKNYLYAEFSFSQEWNNTAKTAIFKNADTAYTVFLTDDCCKVPYEVSGADFCVSVFGTNGNNRITTNETVVLVEESGYTEGETPVEPTPAIYEQLSAQTAEAVRIANNIRDEIESKVNEAELAKKADKTEVIAHTNNLQNPHRVTKSQIGLSNVDNTADKDKPVSDAVAEALSKKAEATDIVRLNFLYESTWDKTTQNATNLALHLQEYNAHVKGNEDAFNAITKQGNETNTRLDENDKAISDIKNEVVTLAEQHIKDIGDMTNLHIAGTTNLVAAINELVTTSTSNRSSVDNLYSLNTNHNISIRNLQENKADKTDIEQKQDIFNISLTSSDDTYTINKSYEQVLNAIDGDKQIIIRTNEDLILIPIQVKKYSYMALKYVALYCYSHTTAWKIIIWDDGKVEVNKTEIGPSSVDEKIGNLSTLETQYQTNVVGAVNELVETKADKSALKELNAKIGNVDELNVPITDNKTIVRTINFLYEHCDDNRQELADRSERLEGMIGQPENLQTTDKSNTVAAINEIVGNIDSLDIQMGNVKAALDNIIEMQNSYIGGDSV